MASLSFSSLGNNVAISASTTSATGALPGFDATRVGDTVRVYNATASAAFFRSGAGAQTALATDAFIAPGSTEVFSLSPETSNVGVLLASGTGTVYFQRGAGN